MRNIIYIYVLDTLADWEIGYILQAISMQKWLKAPQYFIRTVGNTKEPIKTLGGLTIVPDCSIEEMQDNQVAALLLPGAETWKDQKQEAILAKAVSYLDNEVLVAAICGATLALADLGILNHHIHTSNSLEYLCGFSKDYIGSQLYKNELAVTDRHLITASSAGGLLWARKIIESLKVYSNETIEQWYQLYLTGEEQYYMKLMAEFK